jgi:membrane protease YdiL (CAAX protease family)
MTPLVADRSAAEAALAVSAAWVTFVLALPILEPGMSPSVEMAIGAVVAAGLVVVGFAAASRVRPMSTREGSERLRLLGWSLSLGALMGLVNLGANLGLASLDPTLRGLLAERFGQLSPWTSVLAAPVVEEVIFRLFLLSAAALVIARFVEDRRVVFWAALAISALVFGAMHVLRPEPASSGLAWIYRSGVTLKSTVGGLLLGWIYWRWGLGYSILSA